MSESARNTDFAGADDVQRRLGSVDYLADHRTATAVYLAAELGKPILVEGPAGTGKTELAKSFARMTGAELIRLQCYEGLDESKALYEWNYRKQLLALSDRREDGGEGLDDAGIFGPEYLLERPILAALRAEKPVVLLIDEIDRIDFETEALLLEALSEFQVTVPELGTIRARHRPMVFLTSNGTRDLSEAVKRRCLFLFLGHPSAERERAIIEARVPGIARELGEQISMVVQSLRMLDLKKRPSVSETLDWARTLRLLEVETVDAACVVDTLNVLLKDQSDVDKAEAALAASTPLVGA
ncbi:MoxR family ATPase [Nocardioides sp. WS12]|uniref:AAA family ATPase n=1 Tax=Nocardioides sp. WS12 TaxID=2486272 RepID=UPI0015FCE274|nr:MoxR family ATPase [Nocardioides sp. WS12]